MQHPVHYGPFFEKKKAVLQQEGLSSVRIVSDFDRTLTVAMRDDTPVATSYTVLAKSGLLSPQFESTVKALYEIYRPIELDNTLDPMVRFEKMSEWWTKTLEAILDEKVPRETLMQIAHSELLIKRDGVEELFALSAQHQIPFFIFSGGLENIIQEHLLHNHLWHEHVHVFANHIQFDDADLAFSYSLPVIHCENKNEQTILAYGLAAVDPDRPNVVLLGDQIGDAEMSAETESQLVLKVGFLNDNPETNLQLFLERYDVVITGDGSMEFVNQLINSFV